jgi:hypothetical protein
MNVRLTSLIIVLLSLCLAASLTFAQEGTGTITGHVTDPSGAAVPNARVAAVDLATQVRTVAATNSIGIYELPNLIPGTYSVEVSANSFKKILRTDILVQVEDHIGLDFSLQLGSFNETVTVTTEAPQLRTEDAQTGEVITESMIQTLVNIDRDPFKLLILAGNVQGTGDRASGAQLGVNGGIYNGPADTRINGGRAAGIDYLVDGVPATGGFVHNVVNATPTEDDVQEFKVITNGISSEYGRISGGVVEVSTKSGANAFHGQLFEYHKDAFLNANNWGNDNQCADGITSACSKSNFRQNDFGFAVGGPVILPHLYNGRNKTFWFANAEWVRFSQSGNSSITDTITEIERNSIPDPFNNNTIKTPTPCPDGTAGGCANLSDIGTSVYNACATVDSQGNCHQTAYPYVALGNPFVAPDINGNRPPDGGCSATTGLCGQYIPISQLSVPILHYVSLMPHANISPLYGPVGGNYEYRQPQRTNQNTWDVRVDHVINDKQRIYGRFVHNDQTKVSAPSYPNFAVSTANLKGGFGASLHYDYTISPTLILDLNTGGNYSPANFGGTIKGAASSTAGWGFGPSVTDIMGNTLLSIGQVRGTDAETTGNTLGSGNLNGPSKNALYTTNFSYAASLTKILNRHTLKFGYDGRRYYDNFSQAAGSSPFGDGFYITGAGSFLNVADDGNIWGNSLDDANNMGTFLWGLDSWSHATAATSRAMATNYYATYLQDDLKVNKKLTLNLGVRWEMQTPVTERHNNLSVWDPQAPSPFTVNSCYNFTAALTTGTCGQPGAGLTPAQASAVQTPEWASHGAFDPGAIVFVGSPEHRARTATFYHPWNFAPRLGFAYQLERNTVVRGSFGIFYLPIGNNITNYGDTPGVAYANTASSESGGPLQVTNYEYGPGFQTIANAFPVPSWQLTTFGHNSQLANVQTAIPGGGSGGVNINSHMPHEYDWSFGIQRQLPRNWLVEATYSGNNSNDLQGIGYPSQFPKNLYVPANQSLYTNTQVPSPTAGQIPETGAVTGPTGPIQPLAFLEYKYPYFGPVNLEDTNIGTSHYESGNFRIQKRLSNGLQLLLNYTVSKALDDVGGPNESSTPNSFSAGSNGKTFQSVNSPQSVYGLAAADETHRLIVFYNYQLPFGRGRRWMNSPHDLASNLLEYAAGGWEISGTSGWHSGTPFAINFNNTNADQGIDVYYTLGNLAPGKTLHDLVGSGASDPRSTLCALPCSSNIPKNQPSAINGSALANGGNAQNFTLGTTVPPNLGFIRNPSDWTTDIAILKSFPVSKEGSRYFQLRLEGQNIFNHPGLGNYDNNATDTTFGMITNCSSNNACVANTERNIQISGRFVF